MGVGLRLGLLVCAALACGSASAGPFEDGQAALAKKDYIAAAREFSKAAALGDHTAEATLGALYMHGDGVPLNYTLAAQWLEKAATGGVAFAQYELALLYVSGNGVAADPAKALQLFTTSANQGYAGAQSELGAAYLEGLLGLKKNVTIAIDWFRKAAAQNYASADLMLGMLYFEGKDVPQNLAQAGGWFAKGGEQGNAQAEVMLGFMYQQGRGLPQDYAYALALFRDGAARGNAMAQGLLGISYLKGQGTPQDFGRAYMWLNLAAARLTGKDLKDAVSARDIVLKSLTAEQRDAAQEAGAHCVASNYLDCGEPRAKAKADPAAGDTTARADPPRPKGPELAWSGTGFFVSADGLLITNNHVVEGCPNLETARYPKLQVVATDPESDLALLATGTRPGVFAHLRGGKGERLGEEVVAVGFPLYGLLSRDPIVTTGIVSALAGMGNDRREIQISAPAQPGNSGGPLLGENGDVIGVVNSGLDAAKLATATGSIPQNVNFAVSLGTLQSFLNAHGVAYRQNMAGGTRNTADIAATATRYTILLECWK